GQRQVRGLPTDVCSCFLHGFRCEIRTTSCNRSVVFSCSAQHRFLRQPRCHSSIYERGTLLSAWQRLRPSTADSCRHLAAYLLSRPTAFCSNLSQSIGRRRSLCLQFQRSRQTNNGQFFRLLIPV